MFTQVLRAYLKPLMLVTSLNAAMVGLTIATWRALEGEQPSSRRAVVQSEPRNVNPCAPRELSSPLPTPLELKERAERVFEIEHGKTAQDRSFLLALSTALRFQEYDRVEELLNQYECGRRI